jgi:hypothetical protein
VVNYGAKEACRQVDGFVLDVPIAPTHHTFGRVFIMLVEWYSHTKIGEQVSSGLTLVQTFLDSWTDDYTHSGDKLEAKLLELETNLMELLSLSTESHNQIPQRGLSVDDPFSIGLPMKLGGSPRRGTQSATPSTRQFQVTSEHYSLIKFNERRQGTSRRQYIKLSW